MSIVRRGGKGHAPGTPYVGVAELIGQALQLVRCEVIIVPQDVVMGRPARALWPEEEARRERESKDWCIL